MLKMIFDPKKINARNDALLSARSFPAETTSSSFPLEEFVKRDAASC